MSDNQKELEIVNGDGSELEVSEVQTGKTLNDGLP